MTLFQNIIKTEIPCTVDDIKSPLPFKPPPWRRKKGRGSPISVHGFFLPPALLRVFPRTLSFKASIITSYTHTVDNYMSSSLRYRTCHVKSDQVFLFLLLWSKTGFYKCTWNRKPLMLQP